MAIEFKKAKRSQARMKIAIGGASGSGKTLSSLLMAFGQVKAEHPEYSDEQCWDKICIIDTENQSGSLYVNFSIGSYRTGEYNTILIEPPFEHTKYIDSIKVAEQYGMDVIIIDSLSHAWSGEGGALDKQGKIAERTGNSYTAWRNITPEQNRLMDAMLQSKCHIIADIRAKTDYVQEKNDKGKTTVKNVGMGLIYRDQLEYEFTTVFMLDAEHIANATKDRTGMFAGKYFTITPETGRMMYKWLSDGGNPRSEDTPKPAVSKAIPAEEVHHAEPDVNDEIVTVEMVDRVIKARCAGMDKDQKKAFAQGVKEITGGVANYMTITDAVILRKLYDKYK